MKKLQLILLFLVSILSLKGQAGQSLNSEILEIEQREDGVVEIAVLHGTHSDLPQCSFNGGLFLFDANTAAGQNMLSIALAAHMAEIKVNIQTSTCYAFTNNADLQLGKVDRISIGK